MKMNSIISKWEEAMRVKGAREKTIVTRLYSIKQFVEKADITDCSDINLESVTNYLRYFSDNYKNLNTTQVFIASLRTFFRYLHNNELIDRNYHEFLLFPTIKNTPKTIFNEMEVSEIIKFTRKNCSLLVQTIILLNYSLGLRIGELLELRINNIDLQSSTLIFERKTGKEASLPIPKFLFKQIKVYLDEYRFKQSDQSHHLFLNTYGHTLIDVNIYQYYSTVAKMMNLKKKFSPHSLRHSIANALLRRGVSVYYLKEFLGHEDIGTTVKYYLQTNTNELVRFADKYHFHNYL